MGLKPGQDTGLDDLWNQMPSDFLADTDLIFDPQAFFNDYMFTELENQNGFDIGATGYGHSF